jgi:hypothetical protein
MIPPTDRLYGAPSPIKHLPDFDVCFVVDVETTTVPLEVSHTVITDDTVVHCCCYCVGSNDEPSTVTRRSATSWVGSCSGAPGGRNRTAPPPSSRTLSTSGIIRAVERFVSRGSSFRREEASLLIGTIQ